MGSVHQLNMLALHIPNALPKTVPWFQFSWHHGFHYKRSTWPRHAGRLLWATLLFIGGIIIATTWIRRPARRHWPVFRILAAMAVVWVLVAVISGLAFDNWLVPLFVGTFFLALWLFIVVLGSRPIQPGEKATWAQTVVGALAVWVMFTLGYGVIPSEWIIFGNSYLNFDSSGFLIHRGQWATNLPPFDITRDKFVDAIAALIYIVVLALNVWLFVGWQKRTAPEPETEEEAAAPKSGPLARLRARRAERVSAYGRPVTTSET